MHILFMQYFTPKFGGFTEILKVKIFVSWIYTQLLQQEYCTSSLAVKLSIPKWVTKHFYNWKGFSFMLERYNIYIF